MMGMISMECNPPKVYDKKKSFSFVENMVWLRKVKVDLWWFFFFFYKKGGENCKINKWLYIQELFMRKVFEVLKISHFI